VEKTARCSKPDYSIDTVLVDDINRGDALHLTQRSSRGCSRDQLVVDRGRAPVKPL